MTPEELVERPATKLERVLTAERERCVTARDELLGRGLVGTLRLACENPDCPARSITVEVDESSTARFGSDNPYNPWLVTQVPPSARCPLCAGPTHFADFEPRLTMSPSKSGQSR